MLRVFPVLIQETNHLQELGRQDLCSFHAALMQQHPRRRTSDAALTLQHCFAALTQQHWCSSSHAAIFIPLHSRSTSAAAFKPTHFCRRAHTAALFCRFHTAALVLQPSRCHIYATSFTQLLQRSLCSIVLPLSHRSIGASALTLPLL